MAQEQIDTLLVRLARAGKRVVRLKGGDPTVFGRVSSELETLVAAGIPFEIVPGVTSAIAGPAYAGIPVTDRHLSSAVAFVTAVQHEGAEELDWSALARIPTVVVLMGAARVEFVTASLLQNGADPALPAAAIERATTLRQRVVLSTLGALAGEVRAVGIDAPVLFVIGEVAALARRYAWFDALLAHPVPAGRGTPSAAQRSASSSLSTTSSRR